MTTMWDDMFRAMALRHSRRSRSHSLVVVNGKQEEHKMADPKKEKKTTSKSWPNKAIVLQYQDLVGPLKSILDAGYKLSRLTNKKGFEYTGYNIGNQELDFFPPPDERLSEEGLEIEKKEANRTLLDVVLHIMFLLGVEQGRRAERQARFSFEHVINTLEKSKETAKNLRIRVDELESELEAIKSHPNLIRKSILNMSKDDLQNKIKDGVNKRREARLNALRDEINKDKRRSSFDVKVQGKAKFDDLAKIAESLKNDTQFTMTQWTDFLYENGWTFIEWNKQCRKKLITNKFVVKGA